MEPDGGLNRYGLWADQFFECHQHWFLIASETIRRLDTDDAEVRALRRRAWRYLILSTPAWDDFYMHNFRRHGVLFAYRSLDRQG